MIIRWAYIVLFIGAVLFKPVAQFSWEIWYQVNYSFVAEELCENTEKPEMDCNGKCYLTKQLKKTELEKEDSSNEKQPVRPIVLKENIFISETSLHVVYDGCEQSQQSYFHVNAVNPSDFIHGIFHPPQA